MPVSIAIIALNEADRIKPCIESTAFADDIVLVDSGSRDHTAEIAQSMGCRIFHRQWTGYASQKQFAVDQCKNDWVMILDADERIPSGTADEIRRLTATPVSETAAYGFFRQNFFHNRWIKRCGWWPNHVIRLVDRRQGGFSDHLVHEHWVARGPVKMLDVSIEHHSFRNYGDLIEKMQTYSSLASREMARQGKKTGWWSAISHSIWMFIRTYFLELGILEGFDGFMISMMNAQGSLMKYAKLRETILYGNEEIGKQ